MTRITRIGISPNSIVTRVSVQASEYGEQNGGADPDIGTLYAVETLSTDGIAAGPERLEHLANRDMAPDREQERMLVAFLQADFAAFVQSGQDTPQRPARRGSAVLDLLAPAPGLSDREIARRVECSPQTVGNICKGGRRILFVTIRLGPVPHLWQDGCEVPARALTPNAALLLPPDLFRAMAEVGGDATRSVAIAGCGTSV